MAGFAAQAYAILMHKGPSEQLHAILTGQSPWEDAPEAIQSWARLYVYQAAAGIVAMETVEERRGSIAKLPDFVRHRVETEIKRIWPLLRNHT